MHQIAYIHRNAIATPNRRLQERLDSPLVLEKNVLRLAGDPMTSAAIDSASSSVQQMYWPTPLTYRLAEFSMLAYPDPSHHSAASDMLASRNRALMIAAFRGEETTGTQAEWADRMVAFVHFAVFPRVTPRGWFGRRILKRSKYRSFFARNDVLALLAGGDHFTSTIATLADDEDVLEEHVDAIVEQRMEGREADLYVASRTWLFRRRTS